MQWSISLGRNLVLMIIQPRLAWYSIYDKSRLVARPTLQLPECVNFLFLALPLASIG